MRASVVSVSILLTLSFGLTACTVAEDAAPVPVSTAPIVQPGAPGEPNRTLSPEDVAAIEPAGHTEADAVFVRDMLHHHEQALKMTGMVVERTDDRDVRLLAERMEIGQQEETEILVRWLQERGEPLRIEGHNHAGMPGLLTAEQMAELEAARGEDFDRLFLDYMIFHHTGALAMIEELYRVGGGEEADLFTMVGHIDSDQRVEIGRMQTMYVGRFG